MNAENVTLSDSAILNPPFKFLLVTKAGVIVYKNEKDATVTLTVDPSITGAVLVPGRIRILKTTSTTVPAANILGLR